MEIIRPEAVRLSDGTELFESHEESMKPFISPRDEALFNDAMLAADSAQALAMYRFRQDASTSKPEYLRNDVSIYRWIRYSES